MDFSAGEGGRVLQKVILPVAVKQCSSNKAIRKRNDCLPRRRRIINLLKNDRESRKVPIKRLTSSHLFDISATKCRFESRQQVLDFHSYRP
jgi:hypothetical protein